MAEQFFPLTLPPGLFRNGTKYQAARRWYDGNLVRFHQGTIRPVGGWVQRTLTGATISGTVNAAIAYAGGLAIGTTHGLYLVSATNVVTALGSTLFTTDEADRVWDLVVFGTWLIATNLHDGQIYAWTGSAFGFVDTAPIPASDDASAPTYVRSLLATPERFLVALQGSDPPDQPARSLGYVY